MIAIILSLFEIVRNYDNNIVNKLVFFIKINVQYSLHNNLNKSN